MAASAFGDRDPDLRRLDLQRTLDPGWFQDESMLGYAAYAERFAGDLTGITDKIDYLRELGVSYLHLMPLLQPREGDSDGGYAVADYRRVRGDLGTMDDLRRLAADLRAHGISLVMDLVLNHVAAEHAWAQAARDGDPHYRDYFYVFPDRTEPDRYEATLPEVFPDFAPGSFTYSTELDGWVWTTFNTWQWDVNWANPDVFAEYADIILFLANAGRRGAAAGRDRVRLEAAGHQLPEPAGGARDHPGAARRGPDRLSRQCFSRPRRSSRRRTWCTTSGRARTTARSATSPTTTA